MTRNRSERTCPKCGANNVRFARKDEEPPHQLVLRRFRKCPDCGVVFLPMSGRANAVFLIISGVLFSAVVIDFMVRGATVSNMLIGAIAVLWPLKMLWAGVRELRRQTT